jgi:protein O-mannosyl-transferase
MIRKAATIIVLLLLAAAPFLPGLRAGFTNWDDNHLVTGNEYTRNLSPGNIGAIFSHQINGTYIPLTELSFALERAAFGLDPFFYHFDNIILHALNALLVMLLISMLTGDMLTAFGAALLWAAHPLRVESVVWVTERKDVLYGLFFLISLIAYLAWRQKGGKKYYLYSLTAFALAGLAKGTAVTLPLVLLLIDWRKKGRINIRDLLNKLPYLLLAVPVIAAGLLAQQSVNPDLHGKMPLWLENCFIACRNLVFYISKTAWPEGLSIFYPYPQLQQGWLPAPYLAAPLAVAALVCLAAYSLKRTREAVFWSLFFAITALPVLQFQRLLGEAVAADRYVYIPAIGLFCLLVLGLRVLLRRKSLAQLIPAVCLTIYLPLAMLSWDRSKVWHDDITLWTSLARQQPSLELPFNQRASAYVERGDYPSAVADFKRVVEINPRFSSNFNNLASAYGSWGKEDSAIACLDRAIAIRPDDPEYYKNRGIAYVLTGNFPKAADDFTQAIGLKPDYAEAFNGRAVAYLAMGKRQQSLKDITKARELGFAVDPDLYSRIIRAAGNKK